MLPFGFMLAPQIFTGPFAPTRERNLHPHKSCLTPSQRVTFIGIALDSVVTRASTSPQMVSDILSLVCHDWRGTQLRFGIFLRLLGKLTATSSVQPLGFLSLRMLQVWINGLGLDPKMNQGRMVVVSSRYLPTLIPWRSKAYLSSDVRLGSVPFCREVVVTDASLLG